MSLCVVFGILLVFAYNDISYLTLNPKVLAISALSGISTAAFVITWLLSVRKSAYMMLDVFLMLGTLILWYQDILHLEKPFLGISW